MRKALAATALMGLLTAPLPVPAASLEVAPTTVSVSSGAAASMRLTNSGDRPAAVQLRVFRWVQKDGKDVLEPTRDVIASPPQVTLAPGVRQTIRIVRVGGADLPVEASYRVLVDELPKPGKTKDQTVSFPLRYSIPVFFSDGQERDDVTWDVRYGKEGYVLQATNHGNIHSKIAGVGIIDAAGQAHQLADGLVGYVLPGSSMTWKIRSGTAPTHGPATLMFRSDRGPADVAIDLGRH